MSSLPLPASRVGPTAPAGTRDRGWIRARQRVQQALQGGAVYALGDQLVFSFGNMVVAALVSRHCGLVQFGIYILTQRAMDVMIQLSNGFLWTPLTFAMPAMSVERRAQYQGSIVFLQACLCVLFSGLLWCGTCALSAAVHGDLDATLRPLIVAAAGILFREFTRRLYFAHLRLKEAFWTDAATVLLQIGGVEWLYHTGRLDVPRTLSVLCAGSVAVTLWWFVRDWNTWNLNYRVAIGDLKRDFTLGRWLFAGNMVALASAQCNPWVLNALLGSSSVGTYSICESLVNIPRAALTSMQNVMGPTVARAHRDAGAQGVRTTVGRLNRVLLLASCGFGIGLWATSPLIARLIYRTAPSDTRVVASVLALNLVLFACTLAQSYGLTAFGRADRVCYANVLGLALQIFSSVSLIRTWHVLGAALALLAGSLAVLIARQYFYSGAAVRPGESAPLRAGV